jgi:hypothetical protein
MFCDTGDISSAVATRGHFSSQQREVRGGLVAPVAAAAPFLATVVVVAARECRMEHEA